MSQDMEHQTLSIAHQREEEVQRLRDHTDAQPDHRNAQWKKQVSQSATYKAEIHALHTELQNVTEKSELQAMLSARMISVDASRPIVESEPEVLLNTVGPCGSPWILPSQMITPMRPTTGGDRTPTGAPLPFGPPSPRHSDMILDLLVAMVELNHDLMNRDRKERSETCSEEMHYEHGNLMVKSVGE